ncbi:NADH-quinone oxidoreductase subunit C [Aquisalimonas sp.]|uniref:NADH-quinone oxidoreductase subunit C n=1 Tax=unclassified Aquisalimonas TaxID=2644645 RepID=UPI0025B835FD|nr:NADH-quinone oxidoreductase subunit C [Aquisalimonas sp.]
MADAHKALADSLRDAFPEAQVEYRERLGETVLEVPQDALFATMKTLRDTFRFEQLTDLCGVDYAAWGQDEWITEQASGAGFSRGVRGNTFARLGLTGVYGLDPVTSNTGRRFAVVYHLLSVSRNLRLRVRIYCADDDFPMVDSVVGIWAGANWFEREAFDLYGIVFDGHPDLRRILTDYGFVGHPFRKDFPLIGNVEVRYNEEKGRVVYQPVTIEPRVLVPRVIRDDNRYADPDAAEESASNG